MKEGVEERSDGRSERGGGMSGGARRKGVLSRGASQQSVDSGGSVENQSADSLKLHKSGSGPEFLGLSRCAACYNPQGRCMPRWGGDDSESSSATDGSGPDCDWDSDDPESSSDSSCSSGPASAGTPQKPAAEQDSPGSGPGGVSEPGCDVKDGAGLAERAEVQSATQRGMEGSREERGEVMEGQERKRREGMARRAPLVKSFSLPSSLPPSVLSLSLLPRPPRVVSTLHLQVQPSEHSDAIFYTAPIFTSRRHAEGEEDEKEKRKRGSNSLPPPQASQRQQAGLPWQQKSLQQPTNQQHQYQQQQHHQLSHHYQQHQQQQQHHQQQQQQQQQQQHQQPFFPVWGQGLPPPLPPPPHTFPVLHTPTPHTHMSNTPQTLHTHTPQTCWHCYNTHIPIPYTHNGHIPRY